MSLDAKGMYINGQVIRTEQDTVREVKNPATGEVVGAYYAGTRDNARRALEAANRAFPAWAATPARQRAELLFRIADKIAANSEEIAAIVTRENGKPFSESNAEVNGSIAHFRWYAEEGCRVYGRTVPPTDPQKRHVVIKQPVGVAACIAPWNFPVMLWARKVAPALAAGCTVVGRAASQTTLSVLRILELLDDVELPPGVLNQITGPADEVTDEFFQNRLCRKVSFTGSTEVGRSLLIRSASNITNLSLELGGQAPAIVFDDCDLDLAVDKVFGAKFRNGGRSCIAVNRIYVQDAVYDTFVKRFVQKVKEIRVGDGMRDGVTLGPLIDRESVQKYLQHVDDVVARGGRVLVGGNRLNGPDYEKGYFVEPCVAVDVKQDMYCMCDETFGPLAPISSFSDIEEVVSRANNTPYGLAAYVYTNSLNRAFVVGERLDAGTVAINDDVPSTTIAPFGGVKQSGLGRECGIEGIEAYLETKHLSIRI